MKKLLLLLSLLTVPAFGQGYSQGITPSTSATVTRILANNAVLAGFACAVDNVPCIDFGTGPNDTMWSDGGNINTGAGLNVNGTLTVQSNGALYNSVIQGTPPSGTGISADVYAYANTVIDEATIDETALTAAATTQDLTLWTLPARTRINRIVVVSTTGFTGGGLTNMQIQCGPSAGSAAYLAIGSIFAANTLGDVAAEIGSGLLSATVADIPSMSATMQIFCRFTSTTANVVAATAGSLKIYVERTTWR